jgi:hypothetical protein
MRDMAVPLVTHIQLVKCYRFTDTSHPKWHCPTRVTGSLHGHSYGELHGHQISGKKYAPPNYMTITGDILIYSPYILWPQFYLHWWSFFHEKMMMNMALSNFNMFHHQIQAIASACLATSKGKLSFVLSACSVKS